MKIYNVLYETRALDVFTSPFKEFLSKYDSIYSRNLFVIFSDNRTFSVHNRDLPIEGVLMYPLEHVVNHPEKYTAYALKKYLYVVRPKGTGLDLKKVTLRQCRTLASYLGLDDDQFKVVMADIDRQYSGSDPSPEAYLFKHLLTHDIKFEDGTPVYDEVSSRESTKRLHAMGYSYVFQNISQPSQSVLGKDVGSVGVALKKGAIDLVETYNLSLSDDEEDGGNGDVKDDGEVKDRAYYTDRDYMRRIAGEVAVGLGTKLNNDQPFRMFLDHFFWTVDGIEIKITAAFSGNNKNNSDSVYYIIDADTPFGILIKTIESDTPIDKVSDIIKHVYSTFTVPNSEWRPSNRDIFLDGERREYKFFDVQKDDLNAVVNDFYPTMRDFAHRNGIQLPQLSYYTDFDKLFINQFIEFLASNPTPASLLIKQMEDTGQNFDELFFSTLPEKITIDLLKRIAMTYELRKKLHPSRNGWHLFKD